MSSRYRAGSNAADAGGPAGNAATTGTSAASRLRLSPERTQRAGRPETRRSLPGGRRTLLATGKRLGVGARAELDHRVVGDLDSVGQGGGHEQQGLLGLRAVRHRFV